MTLLFIRKVRCCQAQKGYQHRSARAVRNLWILWLPEVPCCAVALWFLDLIILSCWWKTLTHALAAGLARSPHRAQARGQHASKLVLAY